MGGRGGSGGGKGGGGGGNNPYKGLPVSSLERMLSSQESKMRDARIFAHSTITSNTSAVVKRKINADTKKYDKAAAEAKKIEAALSAARKRKKRDIPF